MRRGLLLVGLLALIPVLTGVAGCQGVPILAPGELMLSVGHQPVAVAIGDVNGDGRNDVATANAGDHTVTVLFQGATGNFGSRLTLQLPPASTPTAIAMGHFVSKKRADVVVAEKGTDELAVFSNPGKGAKPTQTISLAAGSAPSALAVADLNGDGYDDLAVATHAPAGVGCIVKGCVLLFDGSATGLHARLVTIGLGADANAAYNPDALAFGDYFGTGHTDLAVADLAGNRVVFVRGTGSGAFALDPAQQVSVPYTHPTQLSDDGPEGKVEVGGGQSCALATPTAVTNGQAGYPLDGYPLCVPVLVTPAFQVPPPPGETTPTDVPAQRIVAAWNPSDGSSTFRVHEFLVRPYTNADVGAGKEVLEGATAAASGRLASEWGPVDLAFAYPSQNAVLLVLAEATWSSSTRRVSFSDVPAGTSATKTFTGQVADGAEPLEGFSVSISGKDAAQFTAKLTSASSDCSLFPSSAGVKCAATFGVTFTPTSAGTKKATLTIDDPGVSGQYGFPFSRVSIPLSGTATTAGGKGAGTGATGSTSDDEPAPSASGVPFAVGITDDAGKFAEDRGASVYSDVRDLGMGLTRETVLWRGETSIGDSTESAFLDRSLPVAKAKGVRVILAVYPASATSHDPTAFCQFAKSVVDRYDTGAYGVTEYVIGNEPNQDAFWQPQVDGSGASLSAPAYEDLLSTCYHLIKPAHPDAVLAGAALNTNGTDVAGSHASTSPVKFIQGMAAEYKRRGETGPIMDVFAFHAYPLQDASRVYSPAYGYGAPNAGIPNLGRLRASFDQAFAGSGQPLFKSGALRFLIDEVGWQTQIPASKASLYTGAENGRTVDEQTQAAYLARLIDGYACDGSVTELLLYHLVDETQLASGAGSGGWQSGLEYADHGHKPSYAAVQAEVAKGRAACNAHAFDKP